MPGAAAAAIERAPVALEIPAEGGGAITFDPGATPEPVRLPREVPSGLLATDGGGGTTFAASELPLPRASLALEEFTAGGGGTTSLAPKSFPITLLNIDPLPDCVGGGGTTDFDGSETLPLARRRISRDMSAEGGGAMTEGAGIVSFELRALARSGAEAGGGTTLTLDICTGALEISRLTPPGAGGITLAARAGAERDLSREAFGAGAITVESNVGAVDVCSRETLGAGAITVGARAGATSTLRCDKLGAGGITSALILGATKGWSREKFGAGGTTVSIAIPLRV